MRSHLCLHVEAQAGTALVSTHRLNERTSTLTETRCTYKSGMDFMDMDMLAHMHGHACTHAVRAIFLGCFSQLES